MSVLDTILAVVLGVGIWNLIEYTYYEVVYRLEVRHCNTFMQLLEDIEADDEDEDL